MRRNDFFITKFVIVARVHLTILLATDFSYYLTSLVFLSLTPRQKAIESAANFTRGNLSNLLTNHYKKYAKIEVINWIFLVKRVWVFCP